jgi:hypothetical protein
MQKTTTTILANVTAATKTIEAKEKSLIKPVDALYADGMRSVDFKAPAKGLDRTDYVALKKAVVAGFIVADRKLLVADTKTMNDATKALKKTIQQKIGARMGDIARLLKAREPKVERAKADRLISRLAQAHRPRTIQALRHSSLILRRYRLAAIYSRQSRLLN